MPLGSAKGKSRKGKSKGKNKGKDKSQRPVPPPKGKARGQAIVGRQVCLRCGQSGHWARNCPSAGDKKRKVEENPDEVMMVETFALDENDCDDVESSNLAVQDGGASSVLGSRFSIRRYMRYLVENGFDLGEIKVFGCKKSFRYGNSSTGTSSYCILLPMVIGGKKLKVLTYIIDGQAPILFGRPALEQLGVTVDYESRQMRWPGCSWQPIPLGHRGEHQLELVEDMGILNSDTEYAKVLMPDDHENHVDTNNPLSVDDVLAFEDGDLLAEHYGANALTGNLDEPNPEEAEKYEGFAATNNEAVDNLAAPFPSCTPHQEERFDKNNRDTNDNQNDMDDHNRDTNNDQNDMDNRNRDTNNDQNDMDNHNRDTNNDQNDMDNRGNVNGGSRQTNLHDYKPGTLKPLTKGKLHTLVLSATEANKGQQRLLKQAKQMDSANQKLVWEVFAGKGQTSAEARKLGARVETFSKKTGWDFERAKDRRKFLAKLQEEEPDEILLSPMCKLWSPLQELSLAAHPERRARLQAQRRLDHDTILNFVATVYEAQRRAGRHCHVEHPWNSRAWSTRAFSRMRGHTTYVDQCRYELMMPDSLGNNHPVKKPTCFLTTKASMFTHLAAECAGGHQHVPLEGRHPDGGNRSEHAENYPNKLAKKLAYLMVNDEDDDYEDYPIFAAHDDDEQVVSGEVEAEQKAPEAADPNDDNHPIKVNNDLRKKYGRQAVNYIARLHRSLGHPLAETMLRMLEEVQATDAVKAAARGYMCGICASRKKPGSVPPAAGLTARHFGDRLCADSAWIETTSGRKCFLTLMDQATRYIAVRLLRSAQSTDFIKGVERAWIKQFGCPKYLRVDEAKAWSSQALRDFCSNNGITLEAAPAEAHSWLGATERKHQVVRHAIEVYMEQKGTNSFDNLKEALIYIPSQVNNMSFVNGYTPNQWVTGRSPTQATSLSADFFNPCGDDIRGTTDFAEVQRRRLAAQQAFLKADTDFRLRRAMSKTFREQAELPGVGQRCYYWRVQGLPTLQKNKWRGPARVVVTRPTTRRKLWWSGLLTAPTCCVVLLTKFDPWWRRLATPLLQTLRRPWKPCVTFVPGALHSSAMSWSLSRRCRMSWTRPATTMMFPWTTSPRSMPRSTTAMPMMKVVYNLYLHLSHRRLFSTSRPSPTLENLLAGVN